MRNSSLAGSQTQNPFRNERAMPDWAQFTRLGGDRVAILFEELRTRISSISGLIEELHYCGPEEGWLPRYRVDGRVLLKVQIWPGELSATIELKELTFKKILNSPKLAGKVKSWLGTAPIREGIAFLHMRLSNRSDISSLGSLVVRISREQL